MGDVGGMATKTDGTVWIWGAGGAGTLGVPNSGALGNRTSSPVQIPGTNWDKICAGSNRHNLATKCVS